MRSISIGTLLLIAPALVVAQATNVPSLASPEIVNVGSGEVRLRPDRALLTVTVVTRATTAAAAGKLNSDKVAPLLAALRRQMIPDSAITTSGYSVNQEIEREPVAPFRETRRYVARNSVRVSLRRLDDLGRVIDSALAAGASEVADVAFESSMMPTARQRAIGIAVRAARSDAAAAAEAAGGTLGQIIEVVLDPGEGQDVSPRMFQMNKAAMSGTAVMPDDIVVTVRARVRSALSRSPR